MDLNTIYIICGIFGSTVFLFFGLAGGYSTYLSKPIAFLLKEVALSKVEISKEVALVKVEISKEVALVKLDLSKEVALVKVDLSKEVAELNGKFDGHITASKEFREQILHKDDAKDSKLESLLEKDAEVDMQLKQHSERLDKHDLEIEKLKKVA